MLESFTHLTFEPRQGETFRLDVGDGQTFDLTLTSVQVYGNDAGRMPNRPEQRDPFSLFFVGPAEVILPQRIYQVTNEAIGSFELFIVPIARDAAGVTYQAVFS